MADIGGKPINFRSVPGTRLFRSSEPEDATTSSVFRSHGIKTILDLRDITEVIKAQSCADYKQCIVQRISISSGETPPVIPLTAKKDSKRVSPHTGVYSGVHAVLPLVHHKRLARRAGWFKIVIYIAYIFDNIFGTKFARNLTIKHVLNIHGYQALVWLYQHILDIEGSGIKAALHLLADSSHMPAVVICSMGKDRTGVTCMMAGHICGHSEEQLCEEYAISGERYSKDPNHFLVRGVDKLKLHPVYKEARKEFMRGLIEYVNARYGSLDCYLDSIGFGPEYRVKLRNNLIAK